LKVFFWRQQQMRIALPSISDLKGMGRSVADRAFFWRRPRVRRIVLRPYVDLKDIRRRLFGLAIFPALAFFCLVYGFFFALTAPYLIAQFFVPILLLAMLVIWALPDQRTAPTTAMRLMFSGFMISLILWPNYVALALPGLPWITLLRLTGIPMTICLLVCLSISKRFRLELKEAFSTTPIIPIFFAIFVALQFLTLVFSKSPFDSFSRTLVLQVNWTAIFVVSCYMFQKPGRISRYIFLICALAVPIAALSFLEFREQHLLWDESIPSFLKINDLEHMLTPEFRPGTGEYRAKATFSTALGLAEYMALMTPFFIHYMLTSKKHLNKLLSGGMIVAIFMTISFSGSRLGYAGMLVSILLYTGLWAALRWRRLRSDLLAPAILFSYPFFFLATILGSFFVHRLHTLIWGDGAQAGSNQARVNQISTAMPHILSNPIGHGSGQSGGAMGYAAGRFVTVDNYVITIALDYGVLGVITYFGMFGVAIYYAAKYTLVHAGRSRDPEANYLVPLGVSLASFLVIKLVFSQYDNHPLVFMMLGMVVALVHRLQVEQGELGGETVRRAAFSPQSAVPAIGYRRAQHGAPDR
jgi:hypothetical protein